jgi:hypothetical protein
VEKALIHADHTILTHQQPTEVLQPGKSPLLFPALSITSQGSAILHRRRFAVAAVQANQFDFPADQVQPKLAVS